MLGKDAMKFKLQLEGDSFDDKYDLLLFLKSHDLLTQMNDALRLIRNRLKHFEISNEEDQFLKQLQEILWVEDIDS